MKHCPWCGDNEIKVLQTEISPTLFVAVCKCCGAKGPTAQPLNSPITKAKAAASHLWNLRFDQP
jgi:Lar family restriction alleviation protein